jgi:pyruvate/2-oxoglutarate dehydrogenase complex dihydrolipoamide acyltransferase (E2) component
MRSTLFPVLVLTLAACAAAAAQKKPAPKPAKPAAGKPAAAKPAAAKPAPPAATPGLRVVPAERRIELDAVVAKREHDDVLKGAIEFLLVSKGGKAYESVFETAVKAEPLDHALKQLGLKPGAPPATAEALPTGPGVVMEVVWKDGSGKEQRFPVEEMVLDVVENRPLSGLKWTYTGSKITEDPETERKVLMASQTNNLVSTHREDPTVLLMNPLPAASGKRYKRNEARLPKAGTPVRLILRPAAR